VPALARIGRFASLDGEVCAASDDDRTDFSRLCQSLGTGRPLTFFAFDLLSLDGVDLRGRPLIERKRLLAELLDHLPIDDPVRQVPFAMRDGGALFAKMQRDGHEGIVAKKTSSLYRSGARSPDWLKLKCIKIADFQIVGWRADTGDQAVNSLVLADCSTPIPIYRGRVGTGFSHVERRQLHQALTAIETGSCPLATRPPQLGRHVRWVRPEFTAKVSYLEISLSGILRTPVYVGMIGPVPPTGRTTLVRGGKYSATTKPTTLCPRRPRRTPA